MLPLLAKSSPRRPLLAAAAAARRRPRGLPWLAGRRAAASHAVPLKELLENAAEEGGFGEASSAESEALKIGGQQGVLWFANIYPTKAFRFDVRQAFTHHNHDDLVPQLLPDGVEVLRTVPREREGGAFVYFRAPPSFVLQVLRSLPVEERKQRFLRKEDILSVVCKGISAYLRTHDIRAFLCPDPVRAHRVLGAPFLEDLEARYPTSRLRVKIEGEGATAKASEEWLYAQMRRYGVLDDIETLPEGKGFSVSFRHISGAVAARNCLHLAQVPSLSTAEGGEAARLRIGFEPFMQKWLREFIRSNARYLVPLVVAAAFGTTYFVWDPLREISVELKFAACVLADEAQKAPSTLWGSVLRVYASWARVETQLFSMWRNDPRSSGLLRDFWEDRDAEAAELRQWLTQPQDQVMLLTGTRGNGQSGFVRQALGGKVLYVDVSEILESGGAVDDQIFMRRLCRSLGYWPAQGMDRMMTALLDMLLPGSGKLSRENEILVAVQRVLSSATQALISWRRQQGLAGAEGAPLPPMIVIDGFTSENKDRREGLFDALVTWAAYVCEARLARVLFVADSSFAEPAMLAALKDRPERLTVHELSDAEPQGVLRMLERHFQRRGRAMPEISPEDMAAVGGRFRDVAAMVSHVDEGQQPSEAVRALVDAAETNVRTLLTAGQPGSKWTRPQLWRAVRLLANAGPEGVPYDVFLWSVFRGDDLALRSMKESNLVTVSSRQGCDQQQRVCGGSPLVQEAFRRLLRRKGLSAVFDLEVAKEDIKRETATVDAYEAELVRLQEVDDVRREKGRSLVDPNEALRVRKEQLLKLILEQQKKLEKYHAERRRAMAVLAARQEEYRLELAGEQRREADAKKEQNGRGGLLAWLGLLV